MTMDRLDEMLFKQARLQEVFDDRAALATLANPTPEEQRRVVEYIKDMCLALLSETHELMDETGWKPWSTSWHVNRDAARGEWIDALHFMLNLANALDMDGEMIVQMYQVKHDVNAERAASKVYDGISTKCSGCKRALDDPSTACHEIEVRNGDGQIIESDWWCVDRGYMTR